MSKRTIEYSSLIVAVIGKHLNKHGKEVRHTYEVKNISEIFKKYADGHTDLKQSIVNVPEERSKKYQKVGVDAVQALTKKDVDFYHFSVAYIQRDQEKILTADLKSDFETKEITLEDGVFQYSHLHVTVVPAQEIILLDGKCHNAPTAHLIHDIIFRNLDPTAFGLPTREALREGLHVKIEGRLDNNYERILSSRAQDLKKMSFTVVKPTAKNGAIAKSLAMKDSSDEAMAFCSSGLAKIFGIDLASAEFEDLPVKRVEISFTLDSGYDKSKLKAAKNKVKTNVKQFIKNDYLQNSVLEYQDNASDQVKRALLKGLVRSMENPLEPEYYLNDKKMWAEHKETYFLMRHREAKDE